MEENPQYAKGNHFTPWKDEGNKWHDFCKNLKIYSNSDKSCDSYATVSN